MNEAVANIEEAGTEGTALEKGAVEGSTGKEVETGGEGGKVEESSTEGKKESPWPDNWRDLVADGGGKDANDLKKLAGRYGGPAGMAKALLAAQREISTRGLAKTKPEDPNDEKAMAEWRKEQGVPDDPTGYKLPEDITKLLTDEDKPILSDYTEFAHKEGLSPSAVATNVKWYTALTSKMHEQQIATDKDAADACEDAIRGEWVGPEYKANINLATRFIENEFGMPFKDFCAARLPDGRKIGNVPDFVMKLSDLGRGAFGDSTFASTEMTARHEARKTEIETVLKTDRNRYFKEGLDKEYAEILQKEEKRKK